MLASALFYPAISMPNGNDDDANGLRKLDAYGEPKRGGHDSVPHDGHDFDRRDRLTRQWRQIMREIKRAEREFSCVHLWACERERVSEPIDPPLPLSTRTLINVLAGIEAVRRARSNNDSRQSSRTISLYYSAFSWTRFTCVGVTLNF
jgi:hypothetical protein